MWRCGSKSGTRSRLSISTSGITSRGAAHLFEDVEGVLWEHSSLHEAGATPQLEELDENEAEQRYGLRATWGPKPLEQPSLGRMLKNLWQTWRYSRGWRPPDR